MKEKEESINVNNLILSKETLEIHTRLESIFEFFRSKSINAQAQPGQSELKGKTP